MRFTLTSLLALGALASAKSAELDPNGLPGTPVSPNPFPMASDTSPAISKRWLFGGWGIDTNTDEYNCGRIGKICPSVWSNGWGAQCSGGQCGPAYCYSLFDFDWGLGSCRDVSSDKSNCGKCGQSCTTSNVANSAAVSCTSGTCVATSCQNGYTLSAGVCTRKLDLMTDMNNCGSAGNRCPSGWAFSSGSQCVQGVCRPVSINSGFAFSISLNKCVDITSDANNCGGLDRPCTFANGQGSCSNGVCTLKSCASGFSMVGNTCVALNLKSDVKNCGTVGNDCTNQFPNGVGMCSSGTCTLASCKDNFKRVTQSSCSLFIFCSSTDVCQATNYSTDMNNCGKAGNCCASSVSNGRNSRCENGNCIADCNDGFDWDDDYNYCRDVRTDLNHCGGCRQSCSIANGKSQCVSGSCQVQSCNSGFQPNSANTACVSINYQIDPKNCGTPPVQCAANYANGGAGICVAGKCTTTCNSGFLWNPTSLSCVSVTSNDNCGSIGNKCSFANGSGSCKNGQCTLDSCANGFTMSSDKTSCTAINTNTDPANCGGLNNRCSAYYANGGAGVCVNGRCTTTCNPSYVWDPTALQCKIVSNDVNNCGSLGNKCLYANGVGICQNGQCSLDKCTSPYIKVGNACVDPTSDVNNCGSAGNQCNFGLGSGSCVNGKCVATKCSTGFTLLDGLCKVIQYDTDPKNCGGDNIQCPSIVKNGGPGLCVLGKCISACNNGFDWDPLGFCRDVTSDNNNCGKCGQTCKLTGASATVCQNMQCKATACSPGYTLDSTAGVCKAADTQNDANNCGNPPIKCPATYQNGGAGICKSGQCTTTCNSGFTWDSSSKSCVSTNTNDNCGGLGQKCTIQNGVGACLNGKCTIGSCSTGFIPSTTSLACVAPDTSSDPNNCGGFGNKCQSSYPFGTGAVTCTAGKCTQACVSGYTWNSATTSCVSINDDNNCGAIGKSCAVPNGKGSCKNGQCSFDGCNTGFVRVGTTNACTAVNTDSDPNNCGAVGNVCKFENGSGSCQRGKCVPGLCNTGFQLLDGICKTIQYDSDPKNCGGDGIVCPSFFPNGILNGGKCVLGKCVTLCNSGFDWDPLGLFCRDVTSDNNNCGKCGQTCKLTGASATKCENMKCKATACISGYTLDTVNGVCTKIDTNTDVNNCGDIGCPCVFKPAGATGICENGKCKITTCPTGYTLLNGVCSKTGPSQAPRVKRGKITKPKTLCPDKETACPIAGSASFTSSMTQFGSLDFSTGLMEAAGGYECVDTTQALDSCGGCVSLGEGQNCQAISHVAGVGCEAGVCVVFSCQPGFRPDIAGTKCVRVHAHQDSASNSSSRNSSHRRHMHSRQSSSHHA